MNFSDFVARFGKPIHTDQGHYLFRQGDTNPDFYIVQSGLLKAYYLSSDGKENIKSFIMPGDNIGSLTASYAKQPSTFNLVCLKPCTLIKLSFDALYETSRHDPELSASIVDFLLKFALKKETREYELLCLSAEERYRRLVENAPMLFEKVTQNEIARYLGITPVGLSRIKKRVSNEN